MAKKIINVVYKVDDKELSKAKTAIQGLEKETKDSEKEMLKLDKAIQKVGNDGNKSFLNFKNILSTISVAALAASFISLGKRIFDLGVKQEQLNIAFNTFLGSAEKGKKLLQELTKFSIVTPFSPDQVNSAAKALLAFGVKGEEVIPTLKMLGDVSAGTGKDLAEMAVIFGQIRSTGRLMGQDLLQLINAGFNPLQVISEKTGKSMRTLKKEMEDGKISFEQVSDAFKTATSEGGLFFNLMQKQSESIGGIMSTIEGNIEEGFKNIFTASSGPLKDFVDTLNNLSLAFLEFTKSREQLAEETFTDVITQGTSEFQKYIDTVGDANEALKIYQVVVDARVQKLRDEYEIQRNLADQEITIEDRIKGTTQAKENEINAAKKQEQIIGDQIDAYELKLIPVLNDYIKKQGLATIVTNDDTEGTEKSTEELRKRAKALEAINKQLGFKTGAEKFKQNQADDEKEAQRQSDAIDREIEQNQRRNDVIKANDKDMEDERTRIAEEAATERNRIAQEEADNRRKIEETAFNFAIDAIGQVLLAGESSNSEELANLQDKYDEEIRLAGDNDKAKEQIRIRKDAEEKKLRAKQLEDERKQQTRRILIETVLNAVKALGLPPIPGANYIEAAKATAYGFLAAGLARKFKKGEVNIDGPGTGTSDSIPAMISRGESVINADATAHSTGLLEAINDRKIDDRILYTIAAKGGSRATEFDYNRMGEEFRKSKVDLISQGYSLMKHEQVTKNFKRIVRSKIINS